MIFERKPKKPKPEVRYHEIEKVFVWWPVRLRAVNGNDWSHPGGWAWLETVHRQRMSELRLDLFTSPHRVDVWYYYVDWNKL